jgi:HNH endonuclease
MANQYGDNKNCSMCKISPNEKRGKCLSCYKIYRKQHREKNKEKIAGYQKKWIEKNKEKIKENKKKYYDKEKKSQKNKEYYQNNKEKRLLKIKEWHRKNSSKNVIYSNNRRTREMQSEGSYALEEWLQVKTSQGYKCIDCGQLEDIQNNPKSKLTIGHAIPLFRGGTNYISNIIAQCGSCNSKQGTKIHSIAIDKNK